MAIITFFIFSYLDVGLLLISKSKSIIINTPTGIITILAVCHGIPSIGFPIFAVKFIAAIIVVFVFVVHRIGSFFQV